MFNRPTTRSNRFPMPAEEFGEGSFTKRFYISIPFNVLTIKPSTSRSQIGWQPITRDGGQELKHKSQLYEITDARSPRHTQATLTVKGPES